MKYTDFKNIISAKFGNLTEDQAEKFRMMEDLYFRWNEKINVISRKDIGHLYDRHILHSISIAVYIKEKKQDLFEKMVNGNYVKILDVGTGGGFPGIPLAVLFPLTNFVLCDSIGKKILVVNEISESLGLKNVKAIHGRAEDINEKFNLIVSRAVTSADKFYPWVKNKYTDSILYLKGNNIDEELELLTGKFGIAESLISKWNISEWIKDDFFCTKIVLEIKNQ